LNTIKFVLIVSIVLVASDFIAHYAINTVKGQEIKDDLNEDQIIVCVNGHVVEQKGLICHKYNTDDFDYYQDAYDGSLFNLDDSFDMGVID
jgi:hypothetical protein